MSARATERAAQLAADNRESVAKGICSTDAAIDAIRAVSIAPRTLHSRLQHGTPFKKEEAERLRDALAEHAVMLA